jgi:glycosyltransferase involved in cell wall biosynthesis
MNILFLTDGITPYVTGGMQKHSYIVSKLLSENNCKITLVHCGFIGKRNFNEDYSKNFTKEQLSNISFVFIPFEHSSRLPGHYISDSKTYSNQIHNFFGINLQKYDLIYAQGFTGWSFLNNSQHIPVIVNLHGFEMFQKASNCKVKLEHQLLRPIVKDLVKQADYVLSFGGKIDDILLKLKTNKSKIIQQSNGIQKNWIDTKAVVNQKIRTITFIGRNERRKGIEELSVALKNLIKENLEFRFNFIGPIPENIQINHPSIKYYGEIKDTEQIKLVLDQSDYLISPSYAEGMPTVILEAMARGNAIIATDVGATSKMLKGNGYLINPTSNSILSALKDAIQLDNKALLILKEKSIEKVNSEFIWEKVIQNKLSSFKEIISKAKKSFA